MPSHQCKTNYLHQVEGYGSGGGLPKAMFITVLEFNCQHWHAMLVLSINPTAGLLGMIVLA
jgi:hypothetical protein